MRTIPFVCLLIVSIPGVGAAQEWADYQNLQDGFKITIPGTPTVSNTTWTSEHGYPLPARVYKVDRGGEHYSITVVDYRPIEKLGQARADACVPHANICTGNDNTGPGFWKHDVRGGTIFGAHSLMKREGVKLTDMVWAQHDRIEGIELQLTNPDQSRTYGYIAMHDMRLYVTEATIPRNYPPATLFQTSMEFVDPAGKTLAYQWIYSNTFHGMGLYPPPPLGGVPPGGAERRGGAAPAAGREGAPAGRGGGAGGRGGRGGNDQQ